LFPIDSGSLRHSLIDGSRPRFPTPAEPARVAPASASRSGPIPRVRCTRTALVTAPFLHIGDIVRSEHRTLINCKCDSGAATAMAIAEAARDLTPSRVAQTAQAPQVAWQPCDCRARGRVSPSMTVACRSDQRPGPWSWVEGVPILRRPSDEPSDALGTKPNDHQSHW